MPRFYFHLRVNGVLEPDDIGLELDDVAAARREAEDAAVDTIHDRVRARERLNGDRFEVADEAGKFVFEMPLKRLLPD